MSETCKHGIKAASHCSARPFWYRTGGAVHLPASVMSFILNFDRGIYPDLEAA